MRSDPARSLRFMVPLDTPRLHLRLMEVSDTSAFRSMTDDPVITDKVHFLSHPFTIEAAERLILGDGDGRDAFWGVWTREPPAMIGTVGSHLRGSDAIEIGYWFAGASQGRGFGTEAVGAVLQALGTVFPLRDITAECRPENEPSWRLLERLGFRSDGQDGFRTGRKRLVWRPKHGPCRLQMGETVRSG